MIKKTFTKKQLQDLVYGESEELEEISDIIADQTRWSICHEIVFKEVATGRFYMVSYCQGSTEMQDEMPFEYDPDEIACVEVEPVEKTVTVYEPVGK